jgi:hypothetical protein
MKSPVTGIVVLSLAAGLVHTAGLPLVVPDLRLGLSGVPAPLTPAGSAGALVAALSTLETALERGTKG